MQRQTEAQKAAIFSNIIIKSVAGLMMGVLLYVLTQVQEPKRSFDWRIAVPYIATTIVLWIVWDFLADKIIDFLRGAWKKRQKS